MATSLIHSTSGSLLLASTTVAPIASIGSSINATTENPDNVTNATLDPPPTFTAVMLTRCILFGVMFLISLIGNVATLVQMRRLRRRKSTINTLIVNLALADLLVTFFCIAGDIAWLVTVQWLAGNFMCKFVKYMQVRIFFFFFHSSWCASLDFH